MIRRATLFLLAVPLVPLVAEAQIAKNLPGDAVRPGRIDQCLDIMYIAPRISADAEADNFDRFEAQIAPHFFYIQQVERVLRPHTGRKGPQGFAAAFVPLFRLRMTSDTSAPVRTPSYNPQFITWQSFWSWGARTDSFGNLDWPREGGMDGRVHLVSAQYTIAHHSNGQDGCTFEGTGQTDGTCSAADFSSGIPALNTRNGNYGTNYETIGVFAKTFRLNENYAQHWAWTAGLWWERYEGTLVARWLPGGFSDDQASVDMQRLFGKHRVSGMFEWEQSVDTRAFMRFRTRGTFTYVSAAEQLDAQHRAQLDGAFIFNGNSGVGLYGALFHGQDYYNIRLTDRTFMAFVGLTWDVKPLQQFRIPLMESTPGRRPQPPRRPTPPPSHN